MIDLRAGQDAAHARTAASTCAQDARFIASAFTSDANSLIKVYQCQSLVAADMQR